MKKIIIKKQYDRIGKDFIAGKKEYFSDSESADMKFIRKSLPSLKNKIILDFGCGSGDDIKRYEKMNAKRIYGIDTSKYMVAEAKKQVKEPENIFLSDIQNTKFKNNFFDLIVSRFALHYLKNFDKAYGEINRILKKSGYLIFVVDHPVQDLAMQSRKEYGRKEIVEIKLYKNKVPLSFPSHVFGEYFSPVFLDRFCIEAFEEGRSPEVHNDEFKAPGFMGIKARKR